MKTIVFLAFVALAQCIPYPYRMYGDGPINRPTVDLRWTLNQRPWVNMDRDRSLSRQEGPEAESSARNIIRELGREYNTDIEEAIERLGREQRRAGSTNNPKTARAIGEIRQELREREGRLDLDEIRRVEQLKDTLEAAIEAQRTTDNVDRVGGRSTRTSDQDNAVFEARIKKLIDRCTISDIESELNKQRNIVRQMEEQERFLEQQKQQVEAQRMILRERGQSRQVDELREAEERIKEEQRCLVSEMYARCLVIRMLRGRLVEEEDRLIRDSITKNMREESAEERRDLGRRTSMDMERNMYGNPWARSTGLRRFY